MIAISLSCTVLLVAIGLVLWVRDHSHLVRTPEQVERDVAHHRAQRRMREAVDSLRTCQAIWNLTETHSPRKEAGQ